MENQVQATPGKQKKCTKCMGDIDIKATKCRHCGTDLRNWINRHPIITFFLLIMGLSMLPLFMAGITGTPQEKVGSVSNTSSQTSQVAPQDTKQASLPDAPRERIESIVKNLGNNYEVSVFDKKSNSGKNIQPPFFVIVNTDANACWGAKQMNFDVMKALYSDSITRKSIINVKFNARRYLSTSLGGDDAREMPVDSWKDSGPTNLLAVLTKMGSGDVSSKKDTRQTWGSPMEECKK